MIWLSLVAFVVAAFAAGFIVRWMRKHATVYGMGMPQRFHWGDVPRLGGVAVLLGVAVSWGLGVVLAQMGDVAALRLGYWVALWLVVLLPSAAGGIAEDMTQRLPVRFRLAFTASSGVLAVLLLGLSVPQAKKARYILPMLPMAAIIAAYPFAVTQGRQFAWLRALMLGIWTLLPTLLAIGLMVARRRYPEPLADLELIFVVLGTLQVLALLALLRSRLRTYGPALAAVLALWTTYIMVVEPLERQVYDTRTFSLAVKAHVQQQPAPLVLHALGKDAKAIKFMVNFDCDKVPLFTQLPAELKPVQAPAWLVMSQADFQALDDPRLRSITPTLTAAFDKNPYVLLHLAKATTP